MTAQLTLREMIARARALPMRDLERSCGYDRPDWIDHRHPPRPCWQCVCSEELQRRYDARPARDREDEGEEERGPIR